VLAMLIQSFCVFSGINCQESLPAITDGNAQERVVQNRYFAALEDLNLRYRQYYVGPGAFDDAAEAVRRYAAVGSEASGRPARIPRLEFALNAARSIKIIVKRRYAEKLEPLQVVIEAETLVNQLQEKVRAIPQ